MNKNKKPLGYATTIDEGENYREIADLMTKKGFPMGHSSARNYVLRAMKRFCRAFVEATCPEKRLTDDELNVIVHDPRFQDAIVELLQYTN